jgi:N-acetyl-gamma-glutamyl-phosphate reductase
MAGRAMSSFCRFRKPSGATRDARRPAEFSADIAILCLPDDASKEAVRDDVSANNNVRIIDTSTAFRVDPSWAYGFAEMDKEQAERSVRRACRQSGLLSDRRDRPDPAAARWPAFCPTIPITVNAVSGYTGGGKQMIAQIEDQSRRAYRFAAFPLWPAAEAQACARNEDPRPADRAPIFSPSVGKFPQGMIVQVPLYLDDLQSGASLESVHAALAAHYAGQDIVTVVPLEESTSCLASMPSNSPARTR